MALSIEVLAEAIYQGKLAVFNLAIQEGKTGEEIMRLEAQKTAEAVIQHLKEYGMPTGLCPGGSGGPLTEGRIV